MAECVKCFSFYSDKRKAIGYDTCPMEGHDSLRVKRALGINRKAEINMVIGCGIRDPKGVYGERFRIPFDEVYKKV